MVEKFQKILENIEKTNGVVNLFALLKMDEFIDKWTVVFCASWATNEKRAEVFEMIRQEILKSFTQEEVQEIARIAIYNKEEHLIEELLNYQTGTILENQKINGNTVHFARIIKSNKA